MSLSWPLRAVLGPFGCIRRWVFLHLVERVEAEVEGLPFSVRESPTAALCVALAGAVTLVDAEKVAAVSRELRAALADLRAEAKAAGDQGDIVDDLRDELAARRNSG